MKNLHEFGIEEIGLRNMNIIDVKYSISYQVDKSWKHFPSDMERECTLSSFLLNMILNILKEALGADRIKGHQNKERRDKNIHEHRWHEVVHRIT